MPSRLRIINKRVLCPDSKELVEIDFCITKCQDNVQILDYAAGFFMCKKGHEMIFKDKD